VAQINEIFSQNFKQMAVAGEVSLGICQMVTEINFIWSSYASISSPIFLHFSDEHDMDFNKFGILIKVKFR
jgi:hypothetical protein